MSLLPAERAQYSAIIDDILASGDLNTISAKQIRKGLQAVLKIDIADKKVAIQELILERFDRASNLNSASAIAEPPASSPQTNGHGHIKKEVKYEVEQETPRSSEEAGSPSKAETDDESDEVRPPKKKRKQQQPLDDAKLAALLQAQENSKARPTRRGSNKKAPVVRKKAPKKKSAAKIKAGDDSDIDLNSDGEVKEVVRKGGFHKLYHLSAPLSDLVGEPTLSRPQVVKRLWKYIKERDLQDPSDKRQIRCDEKMQLVFKQEKVHMFTMNKILGKQLYDVEE